MNLNIQWVTIDKSISRKSENFTR